ncbi:UNVERIFIED_CONTAM: hypothetical protein Sradi_3267800 [Sesamum radiatum]|uniref:Uncharacterized protein n=1 Tax=Sesamum radiatum TaxID=300843 RepID=A0AAW2R0D2_SESRA
MRVQGERGGRAPPPPGNVSSGGGDPRRGRRSSSSPSWELSQRGSFKQRGEDKHLPFS